MVLYGHLILKVAEQLSTCNETSVHSNPLEYHHLGQTPVIHTNYYHTASEKNQGTKQIK